jgi:hypothetical protein
MSLNALHLRLSELRGKALAMSEEKESLSERKAIEEDTTPVLEPQSVSVIGLGNYARYDSISSCRVLS